MNKLVVPVVLMVGGMATLMGVAISEGGVPEVKVAAVYAPDGSLAWGERELKVHGLLAGIESAQRPLRFTLKDEDHPERVMTVVADLNRPDTFQVDYDVSVVGHCDVVAGVFRANKIFTKCPSKYEADEKAGIGSRTAKKADEAKKALEAKKADEGGLPAPTGPTEFGSAK